MNGKTAKALRRKAVKNEKDLAEQQGRQASTEKAIKEFGRLKEIYKTGKQKTIIPMQSSSIKLSLAIPTYNRFDMVNESFAQVLDDPRINDIVLMDDFSTDGSFEKLSHQWKGHYKVKVIRQPVKNVGMSRNKRDAVSLAKNNWVILFDDDNVLWGSYLKNLLEVYEVFDNEWEIFMPDFAHPNFDYKSFAEESIHINTLHEFVDRPNFMALFNTCNYVVNKDFYLKTWQANPEMKGTDTAWHNLNHLKAGGSFYIVPNMRYTHRVHPESGFMKDVAYNMEMSEKIHNQLKEMAHGLV